MSEIIKASIILFNVLNSRETFVEIRTMANSIWSLTWTLVMIFKASNIEERWQYRFFINFAKEKFIRYRWEKRLIGDHSEILYIYIKISGIVDIEFLKITDIKSIDIKILEFRLVLRFFIFENYVKLSNRLF